VCCRNKFIDPFVHIRVVIGWARLLCTVGLQYTTYGLSQPALMTVRRRRIGVVEDVVRLEGAWRTRCRCPPGSNSNRTNERTPTHDIQCRVDLSACLHVNKKSELMLMRCARAYSSSCSQVILVHPFRRNSLFFNQKSLKPLIFSVQGQSRSSMLTILRSPSPVLVMLSSMSVLICNHFHVRQASSRWITTF